ncbi:MAG: THO complex subunit 2 [Piccolia ochrophora]|nr:MAG: THO complex subunit 2 [Piccolia ochrophora]
MAPGKRKRGDRTYSQDSTNDSQRPSPHRPGNLNLGQQSREQEFRNRQGGYPNGRRHSRGGRGGGTPRADGGHPQGATNPPSPFPQASRGNAPDQSPAPATPARLTETPAHQPQPPQQSQDSVPAPDPIPYDFEYLTEETMSTWKPTGRGRTVDVGVQARLDEDAVALNTLFQELITAGHDGRLDPKEAGSTIKDVIGEPPSSDDGAFDAQLLFLDCLSIVTEHHISDAFPHLIRATAISPATLRQNLSEPLLESLGLVRNTFTRLKARRTTNLLYRQANFNLLREETEGYSKLMTELFTTSNNEPPTSEIVETTFGRVTALVGAFDLDVGRVLDITLDVFASVLVKQNRFYVKLLRASSWWPKGKEGEGLEARSQGSNPIPSWALPGSPNKEMSEEEMNTLAGDRHQRDRIFWNRVGKEGLPAFFDIGRRRIANADASHPAEEVDVENEAEDDQDRQWIRATGTLPPTGNRIAAQLLGFKLRFYASAVRDTSDTFPPNLVYLSALLIKIGFISLRDLYPHLWPLDEDMEVVKTEKMKEKAEREKLNRPGGGAANALMMAGALSDDTIVGSRLRETDGNRGTPLPRSDLHEKAAVGSKAEEQTRSLDAADNQKVLLLKSLLCIGALPEALFVLGRFPWLPDAFPDLPEYIHRILHHCLQKVYDPLRPLADQDSLRAPQQVADPDQSGVPKGQLRLMEVPARRSLRWALLDREDTNDGVDYRFYWDDWAENIPICQNIDDVFSLCKTLLNLSGVKIGTDPPLLIKLARIGKKSLAEDMSDANLARWTDLSKRLLVPALSLTRTNPGVVNEIYDLIKSFGTSVRYSIYAEWYSGTISRLPDIKSAFDQARAETKDVLKRISKTNVKQMARALAKVAYASPGIVFDVAISQIEAYDNLVEVVVECARYFTYLGYDVLTWSLMSHLGGRGRERVQKDGMLTSKWLAALALFAGRVFKRYSSLMNPTPILQYVTDQLKKGNSVDLIVLKELTTAMAGIVSDTNFNQAQSLAMAGGELLRQQTLLQLFDKRHESRTTAKRLLRSLSEPKLAGQLLIAIAQERQTCIFGLPEEDSHLKLLGNLFDEIHRVLSQYLDLLRSNLAISDFDALVPNVASLILEYGIDPNVAFWISRTSIIHEMAQTSEIATKSLPNGQPAKTLVSETDLDGDTGMDESSTEPIDVPEGKRANETSEGTNGVLEVTTVDADTKSSVETSTDNLVAEPWHPALKSLMDSLRPTLPQETWNIMSLPFYVTFWQLSLYDIQVPTKSYEEEVSRLKNRWIAVKDDRSDMSIAGGAKKEKEKKQLTDLQDQLRDELKSHIQSFSQTKSRLTKEKDHWFKGCWGKWDALNKAIIQHCIVPRILITANDSTYCFKMLKFLHNSGTPNFRTMGLLDHLLRQSMLANLIFIFTAREAEHFGFFLNEVLKDLGRWHTDKTVYEKEALGVRRDLPGFAKKMIKDVGPETFLEYEDFRRLLYKWHLNVNGALKACLTGGEYMHIRNAIVVLKAIAQCFPAVNWNGRDQVTCVTELSKSEKREDLKIAATSVLGSLKKREKQWMLPQAFRSSANADKNELTPNVPGAGRERSTSARPATPQPPSQSAKSLSAAAPEFQPKSQPNVNGAAPVQQPKSKQEVEDGEIDDAKAKSKPSEPQSAPERSKEPAPQPPQQRPDLSPPEDSKATAVPDVNDRANGRSTPKPASIVLTEDSDSSSSDKRRQRDEPISTSLPSRNAHERPIEVNMGFLAAQIRRPNSLYALWTGGTSTVLPLSDQSSEGIFANHNMESLAGLTVQENIPESFLPIADPTHRPWHQGDQERRMKDSLPQDEKIENQAGEVNETLTLAMGQTSIMAVGLLQTDDLWDEVRTETNFRLEIGFQGLILGVGQVQAIHTHQDLGTDRWLHQDLRYLLTQTVLYS